MKLPLRWLKEYVDYNVTNEEFVEKMMWRGFEIAAIEPELPGVEGVVVGRVNAIEKHANSDHLNICQVDIGTEVLQIVTGAQNVTAGALVPVAVVGAKLGNQVMQPARMRGVDSFGMLCSGKELGLTEADYPGSEVYGILILQEEHPLGQPIAEAVGMDSVVFDIELTPNRPDCASIIGICREAAAALGQPFTEPVIRKVAGTGNEADYASVTVENGALCPRYTARSSPTSASSRRPPGCRKSSAVSASGPSTTSWTSRTTCWSSTATRCTRSIWRASTAGTSSYATRMRASLSPRSMARCVP